jgi:ABC-type phosphate transport system substrate-binding protein
MALQPENIAPGSTLRASTPCAIRRVAFVMKTRLAAVLVSIVIAGARPAAAGDGFKVIVNAKLTGQAVSRETLAQVFLGRVERWSDGKQVAPVDLTTTSPVRAAFSQTVLGMSILSVRQHWTRSIASGRVPPMARSTDEDVIAFVSTRMGGVGYVSADAILPDTVRALAVQ